MRILDRKLFVLFVSCIFDLPVIILKRIKNEEEVLEKKLKGAGVQKKRNN